MSSRIEDDLPFRQVAQYLPTPCWISDSEGRIIWVNDAWLTYTGKDVATLATEGLASIHDPKTLPAVQAKWLETKAAGQPAEMTFPLRGRDGRLRLFLTRVVPLRDSEGRVRRWFGTNTDVSREVEAAEQAQRWETSLHENETRLRLATEAAGVGVWEWRLATNEMIYSQRAREISGFSPDGKITYEMVVAVTHPDDLPRTSAQAARALDPLLRNTTPYEYRIVRPSGEVRWVVAHGDAVFEPGPDGALRATRYVGTLIDVTERKAADDAIRESEQQLQMALRASRMAAWRVDVQGRLASNPELNALIGLPSGATPDVRELEANYPPGEMDRIRAAADGARRRGERHFDIEYRFRRMDGELRWFYSRAEALERPDGFADGIIGIVMDITQRKEDDDQLRFLAREIDHRANNLLAIVESIVALSQGDTVQDLRSVLRGRVHALARAHQLLADARWVGTDLHRLVGEELSPYGVEDAGSRLRISGPRVVLAPSTAQAVAMVLHELATNAAKHGALSREAGVVDVSWAVQSDTLRLCWQESGGPPVAPPARQGFGTSVIGRALVGPPGGEARLEWRPEGLFCELSAKLPFPDPLRD